MPKRVDHEERRQKIADALLRTAATRGLHATGMREVAAEAGVSLRLVQYYFGTKEELLLAAMQYLAARFGARAVARFRAASGSAGPASPRAVIAAILAEALPADEDRRTFYVVYTAYLALSLTDPALAIAPLVKNSDTVIHVVAAQLRAAQAAGHTPVHLDPDLEAFSLTAMSAGLATSVLAGQSSIQQAQALIDYHLDRLFPPSRSALHRAPTKVPATGRWAAQAGSRPVKDLENLFDEYWLMILLADRLFLAEFSAEPFPLSRSGESCLLRCTPSPTSRRARGCPGNRTGTAGMRKKVSSRGCTLPCSPRS